MAFEVIGNDKDVESMTLDIWEETLNVALRATMLGCKYAIPLIAAAAAAPSSIRPLPLA